MDTLISAIDLKDDIPESLHHKCHFAEKIPNDPVPFMASLNFGFKAPDEKQVYHSVIADSLESLIGQMVRGPESRCDYCKVTLAQQAIISRIQSQSVSKKEFKQALRVLIIYGKLYSNSRALGVIETHLNGQSQSQNYLVNAALSIAQDCIVVLAE